MDLKIQNLSLQINNISILKNIDFKIERGKKVAIIGTSGSGKTSLLKVIAGIILPSSEDEISYVGKSLKPQNLLPGNEYVKYVDQNFELHKNLTVVENLNYELLNHETEKKAKIIKKLSKAFQLKKILNSKVETLSGGEKQRVAIARALANFPEILLLDEPFNNLDFELRSRALNYIRKECEKRQTILITVSHKPEEILGFYDKVIIMKDGKIIQKGNPLEVYYMPKSKYAAGLLGSYNLTSDYQNTEPYQLRDKTFFRPEQVEIIQQKDKDSLEAEVTNCVFYGSYYLISAKLKKGKDIIFLYNKMALDVGNKIILKIEKKGN